MRDVSVVVLGKYNAVFAGFLETANQYLEPCPKVFVRDGQDIPDPGDGWNLVQGPAVFSMAGNANLGWRAANPEHDLLYIGDDVRFRSSGPIAQLQADAYSMPGIGILSPLIIGAASNPLQTNPHLASITFTKKTLAFICVYIKRDLINSIGYLDEEFKQYGYDDDDYCRRARLAGFLLAVTPHVRVVHWEDAHATFRRNPTWPTEKNREYYFKKWEGKPE